MKMSDRELTALEKSIYHWYEVLWLALADMWDEISITADDCALCNYHTRKNGTVSCERCVVCRNTGWRDCVGTPYQQVSRYLNHTIREDDYRKVVAINAITRQINFLESLDTGE